MSRSFLKSSWMKEQIKKHMPWLKKSKNPHKFDEMPKNFASKDVRNKCPQAEWLQEPSNYKGHKPHKEGHRMVSGIVRAKTKEEIRDEIKNSFNDLDINFDSIQIIPENEESLFNDKKRRTDKNI